MTDHHRQVNFAKVHLIALNMILAIEFILGIALTTLINFTPGRDDATQTGFLIAHIVLGAALVIGATARLIIAFRARMLRIISGAGLVSIIVAFVTGAIDAQNGSTVMAFLMGLFFVAAIALYGMGITLLD